MCSTGCAFGTGFDQPCNPPRLDTSGSNSDLANSPRQLQFALKLYFLDEFVDCHRSLTVAALICTDQSRDEGAVLQDVSPARK